MCERGGINSLWACVISSWRWSSWCRSLLVYAAADRFQGDRLQLPCSLSVSAGGNSSVWCTASFWGIMRQETGYQRYSYVTFFFAGDSIRLHPRNAAGGVPDKKQELAFTPHPGMAWHETLTPQHKINTRQCPDTWTFLCKPHVSIKWGDTILRRLVVG